MDRTKIFKKGNASIYRTTDTTAYKILTPLNHNRLKKYAERTNLQIIESKGQTGATNNLNNYNDE